jgi:hypothetical protein
LTAWTAGQQPILNNEKFMSDEFLLLAQQTVVEPLLCVMMSALTQVIDCAVLRI